MTVFHPKAYVNNYSDEGQPVIRNRVSGNGGEYEASNTTIRKAELTRFDYNGKSSSRMKIPFSVAASVLLALSSRTLRMGLCLRDTDCMAGGQPLLSLEESRRRHLAVLNPKTGVGLVAAYSTPDCELVEV